MTSTKYRILSISDLHLDHPKVSAEHMITSLELFLLSKIPTAKLLFIAGDTFHRHMKVDSINALKTIEFLQRLLTICKTSNCKLRVLRGTFTHDRNQCQLFESLNEHINADLKYFDNVELEHIEDLALKVLYLPDNLPYTDSEECISDIKKRMSEVLWDTVDLVIGHGYFEHVLPPGAHHKPPCLFTKNQFKDFVKGLVLMGHVHTSSRKGNILYHGSFERMNHGEEESKGYLIIDRDGDKYHPTFVENTNSILFSTIYPRGNTVDELFKDLQKQVLDKFGSRPYGHLRIGLSETDLRQVLVSQMSELYGEHLHVTGLNTTKPTTSDQVVTNHNFQVFTQVEPTEENLAELIKNHMQETNQPELDIERIRELLV